MTDEHTSTPAFSDRTYSAADEKLLDLQELAVSRFCKPITTLGKFHRLLQSCRTYPLNQILLRVWKKTKQRLGLQYFPDNDIADAKIRETTAFQSVFFANERQRGFSVELARTGKLKFLNQSADLGQPIDWLANLDPRQSLLWRFQLHYHEFLLQVAIADEFDSSDFIATTIQHWIESNSVRDKKSHEDAWHPYCISRRIPIWLQLAAANPSLVCDTVLKSIVDQVDFLSRNLETDLRGNHLIENLIAVGFASCFFEGELAENWAKLCKSKLQKELEFQILNTGEHYERSPMYHCVVLANLIKLVIVAKTARPSIAKLCKTHAAKMLHFLKTICCPDGEIPLLSDSCFGEAPSVSVISKLADMAGLPKSDEYTDKEQSTVKLDGYWIWSSNQNRLLFDAGSLAAPGLPGHAHCDLLNFVGSLDGKRFIVDSGNSSYATDDARIFDRSSLAHNVAILDQIDHAEVWSNFRMGDRGAPTKFVSGQRDGFSWVMAAHNAYRKIGFPEVCRWLIASDNPLFWCCIDWVPESIGKQVDFDGILHFAPDMNVFQFDNQLIVENSHSSYQIRFLGTPMVQLAKSWRSIGFGRRLRNSAVVYSAAGGSTHPIAWYLNRVGCRISANLTYQDHCPSLEVEVNHTAYTLGPI